MLGRSLYFCYLVVINAPGRNRCLSLKLMSAGLLFVGTALNIGRQALAEIAHAPGAQHRRAQSKDHTEDH